VQFYGTVIYTSDKLLKDNPGLVKRFLTATLQSLIWTRDHQAEAVGYVVKVSPDRDQELETKKLGIIYKLYRSPDYAQHFGQMTDAKWQSSIDIMSKGNSDMPTPPDAHTMYSNSILDSIEESKTLAALVDKAS
jgi:NitT/TauT family transport system substrate-binding protein